MKTPRGLRNNNPLNIRKSRKTTWVGQSEKQEDRAFVQFCSIAYGYRAAFKVLQNYRVLYDCMTLRQYIQRWAPPIENNTEAYVSSVARTAGVNPDTLLPLSQKGQGRVGEDCGRHAPGGKRHDARSIPHRRRLGTGVRKDITVTITITVTVTITITLTLTLTLTITKKKHVVREDSVLLIYPKIP